jgi:SpoIID/LytB domain protein
MPDRWPAEALQAQAVVARTYALTHLQKGGDFDLYPDTRSQVYLGIAHEAPSATAAVQATAGQVVLYGGKVATTYFFSSSGGRTASAPEVFASAAATPYLVSVNDPYDAISPHHRWGPFVVSAKRLRKMLGVRGALSDVTLELGPSGRVETITGVGAQGASSMKGWDFRRALDLDSTWFRVGVLSLGNPQAPVTYGTRVQIDGIARSMPSVRIDRRQPGASWEVLRPVTPGPGGSVVIKAKPKLPTDYRLVSGRMRSGVAHVSVAPLVRFHGMPNASTLRGYARPVFPGASAALQRSTGGGWKTVARATVDQNGDFEAHVSLTPGDYRFRLAPGQGFVPGVSATLKVGPA